MGSLERIGESRAAWMQRDLVDMGASLDLQRRKINHQAIAMETMAGAITQHAADHQRLTERVEELEAELSYRLLPFWSRWAIHARFAVSWVRALGA